MVVHSNPEVEKVFENYPVKVNEKMLKLRALVIDSANEIDEIVELEETLKWGEPSYLTKHGSTLRMDWKAKNPNQYALYFKCTSKLVPTFKFVYGDLFHYEGTRAIVFTINEKLPEAELKNCIKSALLYHKVKKLPQLGLA